MSTTKPIKKLVVKPTSPKQKKKKCVKNTFELTQFKKMIGKGLIVVYKGSVALPDQDIREKILSGGIKSIAMTGFVSSGIIYVFNGVERLLAIHSVSYAEIKKHNLEIDIILNQYSKLEPKDINL
jgi:hypothetical protein